ncbi:MAG: hypothetical protein ACOCX9_06850 [Spirochaetota bacterium]
MMKKILSSRYLSSMFLVIILMIATGTLNLSGQYQTSSFIQQKITSQRLRFMPVPDDFRNYFILQSLGENTTIIIGDFTGIEKVVSMISDDDNDDEPDEILEYYPEQKKTTKPLKPATSFYKSFKEMKQEIINGNIFKMSYSYKMNSIGLLVKKLKAGRDIFRHGHGYNVKVYDPDAGTTIMAEYFFGKKDGRYDLIFSTKHYKLYKTKISPPVHFSVYCRNSNDPLVAETVERLLKLVR